ncbi:LysR family transcriptional regulator [Terrabacter lapilli]|uniref:LysR family transcriptional regulator n=1 Tax=Terrabacter lapilli TaxID=436231 RepID=UPI0031D70C51
MESRELRYFVTVAEEGNFTRAAARLYMTQPALSRAVRQIERDLGTVLFIRNHKGASLTFAGQVLLREGRAVLQTLDQAEARTRAAGNIWGLRRTGPAWASCAPSATTRASDETATRPCRPEGPSVPSTFPAARPAVAVTGLVTRQSAC